MVNSDSKILEDIEPSPLHLAAQYGHVGITRLLLEKLPINQRAGRTDKTLIVITAEHLPSDYVFDRYRTVEELLKLGADPNRGR